MPSCLDDGWPNRLIAYCVSAFYPHPQPCYTCPAAYSQHGEKGAGFKVPLPGC